MSGKPWTAKYFTTAEFTCKCGCGLVHVDWIFLSKLDALRAALGSPMAVNSGCRCAEYNKKVGGASLSDHLADKEDVKCFGVDIKVLDSRTRFTIVQLAIEMGFKRIGIYKDFIHLGMRPENPAPVMWVGH